MLFAIYLTGAVAILMMIAFRFGAPRSWSIWGQVLLLCSFSLIASALLRAHSYWLGSGFAVAVLYSVVATVRGRFRDTGKVK